MISLLRGKVAHKTLGKVVVDVNGVGYGVTVPLSTYYRLPEAGSETELKIHTSMKDSSIELFGFHTEDGEYHEVGGIYREVVPNEKLVFTWAWHTMKERESQVTVTIKRDGNGSILTLLHEKFADEAARDGHQRGWTGSLDKLEKLFA